MKVQSKSQLRSVIRHLVACMESLNGIEEKDYAEIVKKAKVQEKTIKGVIDNAERGNIFMMLFFVRELIEHELTEK